MLMKPMLSVCGWSSEELAALAIELSLRWRRAVEVSSCIYLLPNHAIVFNEPSLNHDLHIYSSLFPLDVSPIAAPIDYDGY